MKVETFNLMLIFMLARMFMFTNYLNKTIFRVYHELFVSMLK